MTRTGLARLRSIRPTALFAALSALACTAGCGGDGGAPAAGDASARDLDATTDEIDADTTVGILPPPPIAPCDSGICPSPVDCSAGGRTTVTGHVFDPAGTTPLANAVVFVPMSALPAISLGAKTCSTCGASVGDYYAATVTADDGSFSLDDAPYGTNVPLVVQVGKWRREITLPSVAPCVETAVPAGLARLPRNQSEGNLPQMAVLTGACDGIACTLRRMGVDASEFTGPDGNGRVHVYQGLGPDAGAGPGLAGGGGGTAGDCTGASGECPLWSTIGSLQRYDIVLLGCECGPNDQTKPDKSVLHDWLGAGGVAVAIHDQETWFENGPSDFQSVATWADAGGGAPGPYRIDTTFAAGQNFERWAADAGIVDALSAIALNPLDVSATVTAVNTASAARYIYDEVDAGSGFVQLFSFLTPVGGIVHPSAPFGGITYCGRAIFADVHVGANPAGPSSAPVPESCGGGPLSPEEMALEYQILGLPTCVSNAQIVSPPPLPADDK